MTPGRRTFYACDDCATPLRKCHKCILSSHREHPFHRLRYWDLERGFWLRATLGDVGYEFALEHGAERCPAAITGSRDFVVVHEHGVEEVPVVFCTCVDALPETTQLMRAGLWPATWDRPRSAITLAALKTFQSLSVNAHTNAHDFIAHLEHLSGGMLPDDVKVSYYGLSSQTSN